MNAYEKFIQSKLCDVFHKVLTVIIVIVVLLNGGGVTALVMANAVSGITTIVLKLFVIKRNTTIKIKRYKLDKQFLKEIAGFSIWVTVTSLAQRCIFNLAPTILGIVATSSDIAVFAPANSLEGYFYNFSAAVNGLFLATVSRYVAQHNDEKIMELMIKVGRYQLTVMGLIFVGFICVGRNFMIAWMGEEYVLAWPCAVLMFIPDILIFTQQIANTTVIAKNKVKEQAIGYVGMAVICVSMSFLLSSKIGVLGSAISIAVSYLFLFIYMNIIYKRVLGMDVGLFFKKCYLSFVAPLAISIIVGYFVCLRIISVNGWLGVIVKACAVCVIYFICVIPALTKEERGIFKNMISSRLNEKSNPPALLGRIV